MKEGFCYLIKEEYFELFRDEHNNNFIDKSSNRLHLLSFRDAIHPDIIWMVPLSSKVNKWKERRESYIEKGWNTDGFNIYKINGIEKAVIFQDMFPVLEKHINREFFIASQHARVEGRYKQEVIDHARKCAIKLVNGRKLSKYPPDCKKIYEILVESL